MKWGNRLRALAAGVGWLGLAAPALAGGGWSVSVGVGGPYCGPRYGCGPHFGCGPGFGVGVGFYRPVVPVYQPVYVAPPPVVYVPTPVVQPVPVYAAPAASLAPPAPPVPGPTLPAPRTVPPAVTEEALPTAAAPARQRTPVVRASAARASDPSSGYHLRQLASADERQRLESVRELGRSREATAIDPLAATLAADRSPIVREAAARALGRIGSPAGLAALRHAAGSDPDRDVRRTAGLAAEMIER